MLRSSKGDAKIAWKSGGFNGAAAREEIELPFPLANGADAQKLVERLLPTAKKIKTIQERHDFELGDVEIALKWSENWNYHIELDTEVENEKHTAEAKEKLEYLAKKLGIHLMTEAEEKALTDSILKKLGAKH